MSSENAITTTNANEIDVQRQETRSRDNRTDAKTWTYRPDADIIEQTDHFLITLDMPGVRHEDVDLSIDRDTLTVHGRVNHGRTNGGRQWMRQEYGVGDYFRRFQLDQAIDIEAVTASCENGVLRIVLPKHEAARPRRIAVSTADGTE